MGHIGNGLHRTLKALAPELVEHQGQQNLQGEGGAQVQQAQQDGVPDRAHELLVSKDFNKVGQAEIVRPGASKKAAPNVVVFKGGDEAGHGQISENCHRHHCRYNHQIQGPDGMEAAAFFLRLFFSLGFAYCSNSAHFYDTSFLNHENPTFFWMRPITWRLQYSTAFLSIQIRNQKNITRFAHFIFFYSFFLCK